MSLPPPFFNDSCLPGHLIAQKGGCRAGQGRADTLGWWGEEEVWPR